MRQYVIGDIHGCGKAIRSLIEAIEPCPDDELIFLGDYIDRGPDTKDVVEQIIELQQRCRVVALRGNHELMLMGVVSAGLDQSIWQQSGGQATIASYGGSLEKIPESHLRFFRSLRPHYETDQFIFVHANYVADCPMARQEDAARYWAHLDFPYPPPHQSGKRVFVGHTPQAGGEILDLGYLVCIDTYCFGGGYLTALQTDSSDMIQVDRHGHVRRTPAKILMDRCAAATRIVRRWLNRPTHAEEPSTLESEKRQTNDFSPEQS
ncbi:metallophosphoesterase family protein [Novipirellula artificiosorum]|uniref:Serine/threonine-protein phosphatase 1 n=1 Tax=Novipirellula artificiosorum TaxID=2528016 RepID=A0A5C6DWD0_9BACT|nr:metallophosphoesterase family protein [Novipirellula artificiosorum]TWU41040.1 Serine/threonine-protein phosphatase 1 [Novipirellula artificiosorum]